MLHAEDLDELPRLPEPVLTAYLNTNPAAQINQGGRTGAAIWLRSAVKDLTANWQRDEAALVEAQAVRLGDFVRARPGGRSKGLVAFVGPGMWRMFPLEVEVENEIYWGTPALDQLLWLLDEHQPCGVVVVSRQGARFFRYRMGEVEEDSSHPLNLDISQWRHKGLVMGVGDEHDAFDQRKRDHYRRFFEHLALEIARWGQRDRLQPIALLGNPRALETVWAALPEDRRGQMVKAAIQPARATRAQILRRAEPVLEAWRRDREQQDVVSLLDQRGRADVATGFTRTLSMLQQGRVRKLLVARGLRGRVRQCPNCGWVDRSPQEACPHCGHPRGTQSLRAVLPQLIRAHGAEVEIVAGPAADRLLAEAEGLAAWLRAADTRPIEETAA